MAAVRQSHQHCSPLWALNSGARGLNCDSIILYFLYTIMHRKICINDTVINFAATLILGGVVIKQEVATLVAEVQAAGGDQVVPARLYQCS